MTDFNIRIPVGCACEQIEIGSHDAQVELKTPQHMLSLGSLGCLEFRETTCVDRCIAGVVQSLWALGVVTTGACCGHNKCDGYVGIWEDGDITELDAAVALAMLDNPPEPNAALLALLHLDRKESGQ
jgi:hypothetical protein